MTNLVSVFIRNLSKLQLDPGGPGQGGRPVGNRPRGWYRSVMSNTLLVVHVQVRVKAAFVEAFRTATVANATASLREPGVARFDVFQDREDPTRFALVEVYRDAAAPAAHKETAHYAVWRDTVAAWMEEPRTSRRFVNLFPEDGGF
jgi:autoinducer 2-degrading protein